MRDRTAGDGRSMVMSMTRTVAVKEVSWGQTLEDFYRIHNLDEKRRKYLEELRLQMNNISLNKLLIDY